MLMLARSGTSSDSLSLNRIFLIILIYSGSFQTKKTNCKPRKPKKYGTGGTDGTSGSPLSVSPSRGEAGCAWDFSHKLP